MRPYRRTHRKASAIITKRTRSARAAAAWGKQDPDSIISAIGGGISEQEIMISAASKPCEEWTPEEMEACECFLPWGFPEDFIKVATAKNQKDREELEQRKWTRTLRQNPARDIYAAPAPAVDSIRRAPRARQHRSTAARPQSAQARAGDSPGTKGGRLVA